MAKKKNKSHPKNGNEKSINWFLVLGVLIILALAYYFYTKPSAPEADLAAATVNGKVITKMQLEQQYKRLPDTIKAQITPDQLLDQLIINELLVEEAGKEGITVTEEEITAELEKIKSQFPTEKEFNDALQAEGAALEDLKKSISEQRMIAKLLNATIISKTEVTENEIKDFFEQNKDQLVSSMGENATLELLHDSIYEALSLNKQKLALETYVSQLKSKAVIQKGAVTQQSQQSSVTQQKPSFIATSDEICYQDQKPIIRFFSSAKCASCQWVKPAFDEAAKEFGSKIIAYHWEMDTGDNMLTDELEKGIPKGEVDIYRKYNPKNTLPTFVFGCRYIRVGNAYESGNDLKSEALEFKNTIQLLLSS